MKKLLRLLSIVAILAMLIPAAMATEAGTAENPQPAVEFALGEVVYYFMRTDLAAGDRDGHYWVYTAQKDGVVCINNSCETGSNYQVTVSYSVGGVQYSHQANMNGFIASPVSTFPVTKGTKITVHVTALPSGGSYPAMSVLVSADPEHSGTNNENTIPVMNEFGFQAHVPGGKTLYYQDSSIGGPYAGKGMVVSCDTDGVIGSTTITVEGKSYTDTDGDGKIEFTMPPAIEGTMTSYILRIKNGSGKNATYTCIPSDSSKAEGAETPECTHAGAKAVAAKPATCVSDGTLAHWHCDTCGKNFSDEACKNQLSSIVDPKTGKHTPVAHEKQDATCTTEGKKAYWTCQNCSGQWSDAACTQEATDAELNIPKASHVAVAHEAQVSTCTTAGTIAYWTCENCSGKWKDAACTQAVTDISAPLAKHTAVKQDAVPADCQKEGVKAHWTCSVCNKYFQDADCTQEIQQKDTVIPKTHALTATPKKDATCTEKGNLAYWYCSGCEKYFLDEGCTSETTLDQLEIPAAHKLDWVAPVDASCTTAGNKEYWKCSVCGKLYSNVDATAETTAADVALEALGHNTEHFDAKPPKCDEPGNAEYWHCKRCDKYFMDANYSSEVEASDVILKTSHKLTATPAKEATCTQAGNLAYWHCSKCDKYYLDEDCTELTDAQSVILTAKHTLTPVKATPATCDKAGVLEHWYCAVCKGAWADEACTKALESTVDPVKGHTLTSVAAKEPTCGEPGNVAYWHCTTCDKYFLDEACTEATTLEKVTLTAAHDLQKVEAVEATCTEPGNVEHWICTACQKLYLDEKAEKQTTQEEVLRSAGHKMTKVEATPATCDKAGNIEYWTCSTCHGYWSDEAATTVLDAKKIIVNALGHDLQHMEGKSATCDKPGYIEHWHCTVCDGYWKDDQYTQVTTPEEVTVTVPHNLTYVEAKDPTCDDSGNQEYWFCSGCMMYYLDKDCTTSTNAAGVVIPAQHALDHVLPTSASCDLDGNIEYWHCTVCGGYWTDEKCTVKTDAEAVVRKATGHDVKYVAAVTPTCAKTGCKEHWACTRCDSVWLDKECTKKADKAAVTLPKAHVLTHNKGVPATCDKGGTAEHWYCSSCKTYFLDEKCEKETTAEGVKLTAAHTTTHVEAVAPQCEQTGMAEYWHCTACGGYWTDAKCTKKTTQKALVVPATGHHVEYIQGRDPQCHTAGTADYWYCDSCKGSWKDVSLAEKIDPNDLMIPALGNPNMIHAEAMAPSCTSKGNLEFWFCSLCNGYWLDEACTQATTFQEVILKEVHELTFVEAKDAACDVDGNLEHWACALCGGCWLDEACATPVDPQTVTIPAAHNLLFIAAEDPMCHIDGNIEYWYCTRCNDCFLDQQAKQPVEFVKTQIPATGGAPVTRHEAIASTCLMPGNVEYWHCEQCNSFWLDAALTQRVDAKEVRLDKGDHTDENGNKVCDICGATVQGGQNPGDVQQPGDDEDGIPVIVIVLAILLIGGGIALPILKKKLPQKTT